MLFCAESPDPLVQYRWDADSDLTSLQYYKTRPIAATSDPSDAFTGLESLVSGTVNVTCHKPGKLFLEFGTERASWIEWTTNTSTPNVLAAISEYNQPYTHKTIPPTNYDNNTYRLETNSELYEGVRYAWVFQEDTADFKPWRMTSFDLLSQIKPVNYTGSYNSSDETINKIWYTGAYASRLNMNVDYFCSILIDRGDRVAIQGDGHPTMAAALAAFSGSEDLVYVELNATDSAEHPVVDQEIMAYPLYWTMTANDYYWASKNVSGYTRFRSSIEKIVNARVQDFGTDHLIWMGWDDRVDNGWCEPCNKEATLALQGLVVKAANDFSKAIENAGDNSTAKKYSHIVANLTSIMRKDTPEGKPWYTAHGLHAVSNAINAGVAKSSEYEAIFKQVFNDSVTICSWSPFNSYYILQALGNMGKMDYAMAMMRLCWGELFELNEGCFWELYSPEWNSFMEFGGKAPTRPSYCHPWSDGPTHFLTWFHAGIRHLQPGHSEIAIVPSFSETNPSVDAKVLTKFGGEVRVVINQNKQHGHWTVSVTAGAPGVIAIPVSYSGCDLDTVSINGLDVSGMLSTRTYLPSLTAHEISTRKLFEITAGSNTIMVSYGTSCSPSVPKAELVEGGIPHFPPFPVPKYHNKGHLDTTTTGFNWMDHYGKSGYYLYAYNRDGTDVMKMPSWANVSLYFGDAMPRTFVGATLNDPMYLQDPEDPEGERKLGMLGVPLSDGQQGIVVDVNVTKSVNYRATVYIAAESGNSSAIRTMDLLGNLIAPTPFVPDSTRGAYYSINKTDTGGVRFRVMGVDGGLFVSAVFLDLLDD
eukprot:TRINITY_DN615_c0_g2_i1.p1 TRINITY_DN615_c0_g2~~TRINITY_DN615_c0_g2_i1.p1  ORF type:complete len:813 (+),score=128.70 TRINITY_DN615_c0_g2_i1:1111-3549(+)